jgi:predicted DNA-binding protein
VDATLAIMMYSSYIMKRTQIYLEPEQSQELARRADVRGVTSSRLIREAIAQYLADPTDTAGELAAQRSALLAAAGAVPRFASGAETVEGLREADGARDRELEGRWRSS